MMQHLFIFIVRLNDVARFLAVVFVDLMFFVFYDFDGVRLYKINEEAESRTLYVAYKKNRYCTHAMREFVSTAQKILGVSSKNT